MITSILGWKSTNGQTSETLVKGLDKNSTINELVSITTPCDSLNFCKEKIPLSKRIKGIIKKEERHFAYLRHKNHQIIQNAKIWFPVIEPILASYGIPEDFKYFTIVESNLSNVKSPQNAVGYWQLVPETAKELGLVVNNEIDERYDPIKSTHAACQYLKMSYKKLGNWSNVAAAYNMGIGGLHKQLRRQHKKFYYDLELNKETAHYVYKGIAVKKILEKKGKYSYHLVKITEKPMFITVPITKTIEDLEAFATKYQIDYETLQKHNPWIQAKRITYNPERKYTLQIPLVKSVELASN